MVWDDILRYIINEKRNGKEPGKHCWSIHCRDKIEFYSRVKCSGYCDSWYCNDCVEIWDDGWKGCAQCALYEKQERTKNGKSVPTVKKQRVSPQDRVSEQLKEFTALYEKQLSKRKDHKDDT